jgi:hypothetical protein
MEGIWAAVIIALGGILAVLLQIKYSKNDTETKTREEGCTAGTEVVPVSPSAKAVNSMDVFYPKTPNVVNPVVDETKGIKKSKDKKPVEEKRTHKIEAVPMMDEDTYRKIGGGNLVG